MVITIYLPNKIVTYKLPMIVSGDFSFYPDDSETKLLNIEANNDKWYFYSTPDSEIISNGVSIDTVELVPNNFYVLKKDEKLYLVGVSEVTLNNELFYKYEANFSLTIGNTDDASINYKCACLNQSLIKVTNSQNGVLIERSGKAVIYINDVGYNIDKMFVKYGYMVNIYGLHIIFMPEHFIIKNLPGLLNINEAKSGISKENILTSSNLDEYEIKDVELYKKDDYFSKSPRFRRTIINKDFKLVTPPSLGQKQKSPILLVLGPMITMGLISYISLFMTLQNIFKNHVPVSQCWTQLVTSMAMVMSMIGWPTITSRYSKHVEKKQRKAAIENYKAYITNKSAEIEEEANNQKVILLENLIKTEDCINLITHKSIGFWSKRADQNDFLVTRVGIGDDKLDIDVSYNMDDSQIADSELKQSADELINKYQVTSGIPIRYSFVENRNTAIMGQRKTTVDFVNNQVLQLLSFYTCDDLKFVMFTSEENEDDWEYFKYLPHSFSNDKMVRYFASNQSDVKMLADELFMIVNNRLSQGENCEKTPHYFIIVDGCDTVRKTDFIHYLTEVDSNIGFNVVILENKMSKLPSKCNNFINLTDTKCEILKNSFENQKQLSFMNESIKNLDMMSYAKILANIPVEIKDNIYQMPNSISFIEMEKVGKIERLNILNRWQTNDSTTSLKTEIGVDENGEVMMLDLHEKAHGPHGLIAGMTGSGKSEFIITYILSMCLNYSPDDVSFILIDYKGGGLAFAFENKLSGKILPHLVGTITNLDKAEMDRTLVSISSELKRRQKKFNEVRDRLGESTIDIYKYQKFYHEGLIDEAIPHLFIICDEFAELKVQQPDFMDNLISVARIGRSLGVHLILATQKPSGVVNDQIWSNTKFRVCLKVQDESDSKEMLKRPEAASISQTGRFYLQVGNNEYFVLGQLAWSGAKYFPSDKPVKKVDKSVDFISNLGTKIHSLQASVNAGVQAEGDQLNAILDYIIDAANTLDKHARKLWLDNIPEIITVNGLIRKYNYEPSEESITAVIGEYDAPELQEQGLVTYDLLNQGNTIIMSNDGAERDKLLGSIIYSFVPYYSPEEISLYIIDYGSESLRTFSNLPHIVDYVSSSDEEKFNNFIKMIKNEISSRKKILSEYGGGFISYNKNHEVKLPVFGVVINNYDSLYDSNPRIYDILPELVRDSERYGIIFMITCDGVNSVHSKISQSFDNTYVLKLKDQSDYGIAFGERCKIVPRDIFGRGLCRENGIHEFQIASIVDDDSQLPSFVNDICEALKNYNFNVKEIPMLPDVVDYSVIQGSISDLSKIPVGIGKNSLSVETFDLTNNIGTVISSNNIRHTVNFVRSIPLLLKAMRNIETIIFDANNSLSLNTDIFPYYYNRDFDNNIDGLMNLINNNRDVQFVLVINAVSNLLSKTSKSLQLFEFAKSVDNLRIIIVDSSTKIKSLLFEPWFTQLFSVTDGIWIGNGISDQSIFRLSAVNKLMLTEYGNQMGYVIREGNSSLCKLINFTGSVGDQNEE